MANGLVQQAQEPTPAAAPTEATGEEESNTTTEEQETYDSAMKMVGELVYNNDESHQAIMDLMTPDDPGNSIAEATIFVLSKIEEAFQGNYPEELIIPTADEISDLLLELADESGDIEITEQIAGEVKTQVIEQLAEEYGADPADLQEALGDVTEGDVAEMQSMMGGQNA